MEFSVWEDEVSKKLKRKGWGGASFLWKVSNFTSKLALGFILLGLITLFFNQELPGYAYLFAAAFFFLPTWFSMICLTIYYKEGGAGALITIFSPVALYFKYRKGKEILGEKI